MYMEERFGAWQDGNSDVSGKAEFKIFFPDRKKDETQYVWKDKDGNEIPGYGDPKIESIQVAGDFQHHLGMQDWDFENAPHMSREEHKKGWVWRYKTDIELPSDYYQYKYLVTFENGEKRKVGDPCTRYGGKDNQNSAFVIGGSHSDVDSLGDKRKDLCDLVVYELMVDDFTDEYRGARAPLDAVRDKLKTHLVERLGVNAVLFMPWTAWPGEGFNWGYTPFQYFSVEYRYANAVNQPAEKLSWLKSLIRECHALGIHVIMDGVFNHVGDVDLDMRFGLANGFPYLWLYQDSGACPYVGKFGGVFGGLKDLDYNNGCTQEFIRDVCFYWIDYFKIDGIRFDNTENFWKENEDRGLPRLLRDIREHVEAKGEKNFSLTIEHLKPNASKIVNDTAATSYWNDELYQRTFDYLRDYRIDNKIIGALNPKDGIGPGKISTSYIGNHDHSHVAWQAGVKNNEGGLKASRTQPYAIALLTSVGLPMIQNGQEFGEDHWVMKDDFGTNRRVKPRPLRWDFVHDNIGSGLMWMYGKLINMRLSHPALRSRNFYPENWEPWQRRFDPQGYGVDEDKGVVIYHRWGQADDGEIERFIIVLNFTDQVQYVDIPFSVDGPWQDILNDRPADDISGFKLPGQGIETNWGRVYYKKG